MNEILKNDITQAWKHLVRAYNYCINSDSPALADVLKDLVVKVSQQKEYLETQSEALQGKRRFTPEEIGKMSTEEFRMYEPIIDEQLRKGLLK